MMPEPRLWTLRPEEHQEDNREEHQEEQMLQENVLRQEAKLQRVRALRGRVENKHLGNSELAGEVEQMSDVLQQKQKEVLLAVARVEELSLQLEALRSSSLLSPPPPRLHATSASSSVELMRLCRELQLRKQLNQDQSSRLQHQRSGLNKKNVDVAAMERRLSELRLRLWKKKAALQPQETKVWAPGGPAHLCRPPLQVTSDVAVAAVGPYIQSSCQGPPLPPRQEGATTLPTPIPLRRPQEAASAVETSPAHASTLPRVAGLRRHSSGVAFKDAGSSGDATDAPPPVPSRTNHMAEDQAWSQAQTATIAPPPSTAFSTGTFPGRMRPARGALHLASKRESPPAADTSGPLPPVLQKPLTVAAASIILVYTQQSLLGKSCTLPRCQAGDSPPPLKVNLSPPPPVYGRPLPSCASKRGGTESCRADPAEPAPTRPLSPTKLLPFLSYPTDPEVLRRRHHAPRPLKKRGSVTEPEGPAGPNIQKLLYQKTTMAAMETIAMETPEDEVTPPPRPQSSPITSSASSRPPATALGGAKEEVLHPITSPHPDPSSRLSQGDHTPNLRPPEVTAKKSILRKADSGPVDRALRVKFNALAILLDSSLEGEYDLVRRVIYDVDDPSAANDEGITALHNAVCAGHTDIVKLLVWFGVDVNAADSDGWTPLHCAASCNNVRACKFLVESGAAVFAATYSDMQTAADKCEDTEDGYAQCSQFLYGVQEKMGVMNRGVVYALWDYEPESGDELRLQEGECVTVLRREDEAEDEWWWARCGDREGYVARNLLGVCARVRPRQDA
nr:apoptosis-stimulating of p53 protein 2-like [Nerophis lumbriciformis]